MNRKNKQNRSSHHNQTDAPSAPVISPTRPGHEIARTSLARAIVVVGVLAQAAGCATGNGFVEYDQPSTPQTSQTYIVAQNADLPDGAAAAEPTGIGTRRRMMGLYQLAALSLRTWHLDPVVRPFSTAKSGVALVLKSINNQARRIAAKVRFRKLKKTPLAPVGPAAPMDLAAFERHLNRIGAGTASTGRIMLHVDGDEYFPALNRAIANANDSIDVRTYIFDNDDVAVGVANLLKQRSQDVRVRVLLDGLGVLLGEQADSAAMPSDFRPPLSMAAYLGQGSAVKVRVQTNPWLTGDHSKTTIIDGRSAFIGGMNIGREYRYDWHDLMMEVTGPVVHILQRDADKAWQKGSMFGDAAWLGRMLYRKERLTDDGGYPVRVLFTRDQNSQIYRAQIAAARRARNQILIENPYFSDDVMLYELVRARRRGVDVRVIIGDQGNHGMMNLSNEQALNTMLNNGIRVYRYPGMTHTKAAIYDGWACLGSANFDNLSLQINDEIDLATSAPEFVDLLLERVFLADMRQSEEMLTPTAVGFKNHFAELVADVVL
jgi:cardiolipin synthase